MACNGTVHRLSSIAPGVDSMQSPVPRGFVPPLCSEGGRRAMGPDRHSRRGGPGRLPLLVRGDLLGRALSPPEGGDTGLTGSNGPHPSDLPASAGGPAGGGLLRGLSNNKSNTLRRRQWNVWKFGSWKLVFLLVESECALARVWLIPDAPRVALAQAWGRCGHGATETRK